MKCFHKTMHDNYVIAKNALKNLSGKKRKSVEIPIKEIIALKYQMEIIADQKGYSNACKTSISICKGECCKWHFPRNLTHIDFFISIFYMSENQNTELSKLILNTKSNHCPILTEKGCFLSFEQRPVLCTNAYPCFNDQSYWIEKEKKNILFKKAFKSLEGLIVFRSDCNIE
ncbi:MAG: hypothetical protein GY707_12950 [Desulfobacteraceae bacterium]|nr:hypothetical protein [Desulfobacteraceae bacterium]